MENGKPARRSFNEGGLKVESCWFGSGEVLFGGMGEYNKPFRRFNDQRKYIMVKSVLS